MLFVSLIPFLFTLFISLLFIIARALVCWTLHEVRRASVKFSGQLLSCNSGYGLLLPCIVRPDGNTRAHYVTLVWTAREFRPAVLYKVL